MFIPGLRPIALWLPGLTVVIAIAILALRRYLRGQSYYLLRFTIFLPSIVMLYFACMWFFGLSATAERPAKGGFKSAEACR